MKTKIVGTGRFGRLANPRLFAACLSIALLASCQKDEATTPLGNGVPQGVAKTTPSRYLIDLGEGRLIICTGQGGNCLPDVIVTRAMSPAIDRVWTALLSGDQVRIADAFSAESSTLATFMIPEELSGVIDGTYTASGRTNAVGESPERFLRVHKPEEILSAYPLLNE